MNPTRPSHTIAPEPYASRVHTALQHLGSQHLLERLWAKDASLWTAVPAEQQAIRQRLGWLSIASVMAGQIESIYAVAQQLRRRHLRRTR